MKYAEKDPLFTSRAAITATAITVVLGLLFVVYGILGYPVVLPDAAQFYILPAVQFAAGRGLTNPFNSLVDVFDPTGAHRFLYYPPLMQLVISRCLWSPTGPTALIVIGLMSAVTLGCFAWVMWKIVRLSRDEVRFPQLLLFVLALTALSTLLNNHQLGRAEVFGRLLLVLMVTTAVRLPFDHHWWIFGLFQGWMAATIPAGAIWSAPFLGLYFSARLPATAALRALTKTYLLAPLVFVMSMAWSPFSFQDTLGGMRRHAATFVNPGFTLQDFINWYLLHSATSFHGLVAILAFVFGGLLILRYHASIRWRLGFYLSLAVFFSPLVLPPMRAFVRWYYVFLFAPLYLGIILYAVEQDARVGWKWMVSVIVLGLASSGFIRGTVLLPFYLRDGMTLREARQAFAAVRASYPPGQRYGMSSSLWILSEDYDRMFVCDTLPSREPGAIVVLQQSYTGRLQPPEGSGYQLVRHFFREQVPRIAGKPLAKTIPGYQFAVYEPIPAEATAPAPASHPKR